MAPLTPDRPRPEAVLSHSASHLVTLDDLAGSPAGERMGPHHRPVPHIELVSTVKQAFSDRGYAVISSSGGPWLRPRGRRGVSGCAGRRRGLGAAGSARGGPVG
jgi:hypothetical protein